MLDLRRLRYFVAIVRCGSMLTASRELGVAQPALSRHMRELESLVGFPLLDRLPRGVRATDAGQILLHHAKRIVAQVDEAEDAIRSFARAKGRMRTLKLSLLPSWATSFTPAIVAAVATRQSNISLQIVEAMYEESLRLIASREIDLAVTLSDSSDNEETLIVEERLLLVSHHELPASFSFEDVMRQRILILPTLRNPLRSLVERTAATMGLKPQVKIEIDGQDTVKRAVIAGIGDSILSWNAVRQECESGLLFAAHIVDPVLARTISLHRTTAIDPETFDQFRSLLRDIARGRTDPEGCAALSS
jgi:LysR family transcriptional regulator, nitrogen assimilation regulatory protein